MTFKLQKLVIPVKYLRWLIPEFAARNGEINAAWCKELDALGWLEDLIEPELMTLQEAIRCNKGDRIVSEGHDFTKDKNGRFTLTVDNNSDVALSDNLFKKKWQIIPAEPKVLSIEGIKLKIIDDLKYFKIPISALVLKSIIKGAEAEYINHKELREAVEEFIKYYPNVVRMNVKRITEAAKNIKPLAAE